MSWQPRETAPKDGTEILMAAEWGVVLAFWRDGMWTFFDGVSERVDDAGMECGTLNQWPQEKHAPRFWMPLPEPPK